MPDLVFDPKASAATLAAVMTRLLEKWPLLPADVQQAIEARRHPLATQLATVQDYQRVQSVIQFLQWLETMPSVATIAAAELKKGKDVARRSMERINNEQLQTLQSALTAALPTVIPRAPAEVEIEFWVQINFTTDLYPGGKAPLTVALVRAAPPRHQQAGTVLVTFADLQKPTPLQVSLAAPGFSEQTGDWTRTIHVFSEGNSTPAIFLLEAGTTSGNQRLALRFDRAVGSVVYGVKILDAIAKDLSPVRSAESMPGQGTSATVDYFTKIDFPGQIAPDAEHALIVQLTLQAEEASAIVEKLGITFADTRKPEQIELVATAPGFEERSGDWRRVLTLYSHSDSQPAVFWLKAGATLGPQTITLDFYHQGRLVGSAAFTAEVTATPKPATKVKTDRNSGPLEELPANPPPPPDLELRIVLDKPTNALHFILHAANPALGYQHQFMGVTPLHENPRQFLQTTFEKLNGLARQSRNLRPYPNDNPPADFTAQQMVAIGEELETIGQRLFEEIFPEALKKEYWQLKILREAGKVRSLLLISDEPWIPWELVKPYFFDPDTNQEQSDDYLVSAFLFARWLAGRGPAHAVEVKSARLVLPASNLSFTALEQDYFLGLEKRGVRVGPPLRTRTEVLQATKQGDMKLLHLAAHGNFNPDNAEESPLVLQGGEKLLPADIAGARAAGLRRERPLVFLNACLSGQIDFALTGLGGWAEKMVSDIGVSAFVGSLWEVNDQLAAEFAVQFYDNLVAGKTLGEAFQAARQYIQQRQPNNPTWLAYTLYADPNGKVQLG